MQMEGKVIAARASFSLSEHFYTLVRRVAMPSQALTLSASSFSDNVIEKGTSVKTRDILFVQRLLFKGKYWPVIRNVVA